MLLSQLVRHLDAVTVDGDLDREIGRVVHDSRQAAPGDLFVAIRGGAVDGRDFVPGLDVAAVLADGDVDADEGVTVLTVKDARLGLAQAAAAVAGWPSRRLPVVGITGTNGKTTTSLMIEAIATAAGWPAGVIGTTGHRIGGQPVPATHTTPEAPVLQGLLARMVDEGCKLAAMEVSSIGLAQRRVDAIRFQVAAFTSFSQDHLDFHGTMEAYLAAKLRLFSDLLARDGVAVVAAGDPMAPRFIDAAGPRRVWRYGRVGDGNPDGIEVSATDVVLGAEGASAHVTTPEGEGDLVLPMVGAHNLDNALAAIACAVAVGIPLGRCLDALAALPPVRGRLERVPDPHEARSVLVDYAHSPDALAHAIAAARTLRPKQLLVVFGCGGDRDRGKRPGMGQVAAVGATRAWITSDNPRSEDPQQIADEVLMGVPEFARDDVVVELDRAMAIREAIAAATWGDVVLIAGKGHETEQVAGGRSVPFDDRAVAAEALADCLPAVPTELLEPV
ncbi:MAG: UDP-N-acetylmuramoyl-L-alanyl-D-glutamate--2,6-diaminopimelate ligase [Alphaproteobacteria bacterium]|nr:UDP-N-acetylmuramoyl-L-alanyl-D-glutamate--2,6-diaminopimelate ligase [Alphaproteobacteria bacterium]